MAVYNFGTNFVLFTKTFVNPYSGETLYVSGTYNVRMTPITGTSSPVDVLAMPVYDDILRIEDDNGNLLLSGIEIIQGAAGNDIMILASATHTYGDVILRGYADNDIIWSNVGNDTLEGFDGNDYLHGGPGNDIIRGMNHNDTLIGWTGNDTLIGGTGADHMDGGDGFDTVDYSLATTAVSIDLQNFVFSGGEADGDYILNVEKIIGTNQASQRDWIWGDAANNVIFGLAGDDILEGGSGGDTIDGGDGWDYARYTRSAEGVNVNLKTNVNTGGDAQGDLIYNVEAVVGSNYNDVIVGGDNKDYIRGEYGDDTLDGGLGTDQLFGGHGNDTYLYASGRDTLHDIGYDVDRVVFNAAWSINDLTISGNVFVFDAGVNEVIFNDLSLFEYFSFNGHADMTLAQLTAMVNGATDVGTTGNDTFIGSASVQSYNGLDGMDTLDYSTSATGVTVDLRNGSGTKGDATGDTYMSIENVIGSNSADSTARDYLYGDDGNNVLYGMAGNDLLEGGGGADNLDGGAGWDYVRYLRSEDGVHINLKTGVHTGGDAQGDTLLNFEAVVGSNHNDTIRGGDADDYLKGEGGIDILTGGLGRDLLYGGTGADIFVFEADSAYQRTDMIRDFSLSEGDKLNITDLLSGFDPLTSAITDFVQFVTSGSNTNICINATGVSGGLFLTAFTIEGGVTATVGDLFLNGTLITDTLGGI